MAETPEQIVWVERQRGITIAAAVLAFRISGLRR